MLTSARITELLQAYDSITESASVQGGVGKESVLSHNLEELWEYSFITGYKQIIQGESGKLGLAPWTSQEGDVIAILHGSRTPVILREESPGKFWFVGQCYLEDVMYGEAVTWEEDEADTFTLI